MAIRDTISRHWVCAFSFTWCMFKLRCCAIKIVVFCIFRLHVSFAFWLCYESATLNFFWNLNMDEIPSCNTKPCWLHSHCILSCPIALLLQWEWNNCQIDQAFLLHLPVASLTKSHTTQKCSRNASVSDNWLMLPMSFLWHQQNYKIVVDIWESSYILREVWFSEKSLSDFLCDYERCCNEPGQWGLDWNLCFPYSDQHKTEQVEM